MSYNLFLCFASGKNHRRSWHDKVEDERDECLNVEDVNHMRVEGGESIVVGDVKDMVGILRRDIGFFEAMARVGLGLFMTSNFLLGGPKGGGGNDSWPE